MSSLTRFRDPPEQRPADANGELRGLFIGQEARVVSGYCSVVQQPVRHRKDIVEPLYAPEVHSIRVRAVRPELFGAAVGKAAAPGVIEALLDPDHVAAASRLATIRDDTAALGLDLEVVWTELDLGRALLEVDRRRAADALRAAAEHGDELGALTLVELAERELRALGVRTWRRNLWDSSGTHVV
jgi:hypothetical protein